MDSIKQLAERFLDEAKDPRPPNTHYKNKSAAEEATNDDDVPPSPHMPYDGSEYEHKIKQEYAPSSSSPPRHKRPPPPPPSNEAILLQRLLNELTENNRLQRENNNLQRESNRTMLRIAEGIERLTAAALPRSNQSGDESRVYNSVTEQSTPASPAREDKIFASLLSPSSRRLMDLMSGDTTPKKNFEKDNTGKKKEENTALENSDSRKSHVMRNFRVIKE